MSDVYDTVFQTQDLEGELHWLGDKEARDRLDETYTKDECNETFRRIDDSYSSNDINDMFMSKADKADVYTKLETDDLLDGLENRTRATFAEIRATFVNFQNDVNVHFQNVENSIDEIPNDYYKKAEVDAIAEELDRTKQNVLHPDSSIIMTQRADGSWDIGTNSGVSIIDDTSLSQDRTWSANKLNTVKGELTDGIDSLSSADSELFDGIGSLTSADSELFDEVDSLSTAGSELGSELSEFKSEVADTYVEVSDIVDSVISGNTNPVTSNGVYNAVPHYVFKDTFLRSCNTSYTAIYILNLTISGYYKVTFAAMKYGTNEPRGVRISGNPPVDATGYDTISSTGIVYSDGTGSVTLYSKYAASADSARYYLIVEKL